MPAPPDFRLVGGWMPPSEVRAVDRAARRAGVSRAELVRKALRREVADAPEPRRARP